MYWHMPNEPLAGVADRLAAFPRKVAWCWAAYRDQLGDAPFQVINLTVRGDVEVPSLQLTYDHMLLRSTMLPAEEAAPVTGENLQQAPAEQSEAEGSASTVEQTPEESAQVETEKTA